MANNGFKKATRMRFTVMDDLVLLKLVVGKNPFDNLEQWNVVLENLNASTGRKFSSRTMKDHLEHLLKLFIHDRSKIRKSGTQEQYFEKERLLQEAVNLKKKSQNKKIEETSIQKPAPVVPSPVLKEEDSDTISIYDNKYDIEFKSVDEELSDEEVSLTIPTPPSVIDEPIATSSLSAAPEKTLGPIRTRKTRMGLKNSCLNYLREKGKEKLRMRERELELEERKIELEERKLRLAEEKFKLEKEEREKRLHMEMQERENNALLLKQQLNMVDCLFKKFNS